MQPPSEAHRDLLPEEVVAGSDNASRETAAILDESMERADDRTDVEGHPVEHRSSDETVEPWAPSSPARRRALRAVEPWAPASPRTVEP